MSQPEACGLDGRVRKVAQELAAEREVLGILAIGSYVAGTMTAASDVDLIVLHRRPGQADRRYCREWRHEVLLDIKFWTPEVAAAMLCGPAAAGMIVADGGAHVLMDSDGSAEELKRAIDAAGREAMQGPTTLGPVERLAHTEALRKLNEEARAACEAGDETQAWCIIHWCAARLVETAHRLAGIPYVDLGQGLRDLRRRFPAQAEAVERCLERPTPEEARRDLLTVAERMLAATRHGGEEFDTGWITG